LHGRQPFGRRIRSTAFHRPIATRTNAFSESANRFTETSAQLREFRRTEEKQRDTKD
jgi:hypothetical protein